MRTIAALLLVACLTLTSTAQESEKVDFTAYGEPGYAATQEVADDLGADVQLRAVSEDDLHAPIWAVCKRTARADVADLLSVALGRPVAYGNGSLTVYLPQTAAPAGHVKGYDVSVPSGRFVDYVNTYGEAKQTKAHADGQPEERTAAEHLGGIIDDVLYDERGQRVEASVVGDRLLYTLDGPGHSRVREALDLLMAEKGGESTTLKDERAVIEKLKQAKFNEDLSGTPVSSVVTAICASAGLGLVLAPTFAESAGDYHIDFAPGGETTAWDAMRALFHQLEADDWSFDVTSRHGVLVIENTAHNIHQGYRVYEVSELLKKLQASYQRQKTAPGKQQGFEGDLRAAGGVLVIVEALEDQLASSEDAFGADVYAYGSRLVVRGGSGAVDAATTILKEMGWEE